VFPGWCAAVAVRGVDAGQGADEAAGQENTVLTSSVTSIMTDRDTSAQPATTESATEPTLNQKITHLEQRAADLRLQHEERGDELTAARAANRELMTQLDQAVATR
jgi:hypothetical protein